MMKPLVFLLLLILSLSLYTIFTFGSNPVPQQDDFDRERMEQQMTELRRENKILRKKLDVATEKLISRREQAVKGEVLLSSSQVERTVSNITVPTMCRCNARDLPVVFNRRDTEVMDTHIEQPPSLATGYATTKHFYRRSNSCKCEAGKGTNTSDRVMSQLIEFRTVNCSPLEAPGAKMKWEEMPDLAVREDIPLFLGVLSYEAPQSLNLSISNWTEHLFPYIDFDGVYIQLNHRSDQDDAVLQENPMPKMQVFGTAEENLNPGLAISRFCRLAEKETGTAENLVLFLEKDWQVNQLRESKLHDAIRSSKILLQRGVFYARLSQPLTVRRRDGPPIEWPCHAGNVTWKCITALHHHYTNLPAVFHCGWFLRYMEPYALVDDPVMHGCRRHFRDRKYVDWEQVLEDGRVPWVETQWVVANNRMGLFHHIEIDQ